MKVGEILRTIADAVERAELAQSVPQARHDLGNFSQPEHVVVSNNIEDPEDLFLPPLQMKMELLKKAVGVENVYDDGGPEHQHAEETAKEDDMSAEREDIVDRIKKLSGVPTAAVQELANDEVFDD